MTEQPRFCQNPGCGVQLRAEMGDNRYLCRGCTERMARDQLAKDDGGGTMTTVVGWCVALAAALAALGGATLYLAGRE